ncbi:hypothetical protein DICSQDRAFT_139972 [Dichomitus squalens LYAD-421 SS1]|uniref:Uncharacterized protein n=1 Tax=Dichomitus squalens (strain LYAD-421) TaxID=732165 RepID=R7SS62_DICSQ|nr:uncharacterized protein DICSQDRAFT_139972 [Dichomitus squalens LYAD-421 SS1]EJF57807.1 hypothetical protein DICSQDRAFT_139972 [Dichomitus squalens LYAD-421 SS1]
MPGVTSRNGRDRGWMLHSTRSPRRPLGRDSRPSPAPRDYHTNGSSSCLHDSGSAPL